MRTNSASKGCKAPLWCFVDLACFPKFLGEGALQPHESFSIIGLLWINTSKAPWGTPTVAARGFYLSFFSTCWFALSQTNMAKPIYKPPLANTNKNQLRHLPTHVGILWTAVPLLMLCLCHELHVRSARVLPGSPSRVRLMMHHYVLPVISLVAWVDRWIIEGHQAVQGDRVPCPSRVKVCGEGVSQHATTTGRRACHFPIP